VQILACFEKFSQGNVKDYRQKASEKPVADHVEIAVLKMLAKLHKETFRRLDYLCHDYAYFIDENMLMFAKEIQFYISWQEYVDPLRQEALPFCYPAISEDTAHLYSKDGFDIALAHRGQDTIVVNDFVLEAPEHILVVTGPNQGGKTTYARSFGQLHYLASLGLCVPGREASLYLFDNVFTHFGRQEDLSNLHGRLQDDLVRLKYILDTATRRSVIVVNEIYASTTLSDAVVLGQRMVDAFIALGAPAVVVTFLDELAVHGPETVSMMSTVEEDDPMSLTFKAIRKPPDGLAYAMHLAGKHNLTYEQLRGRLTK